MTEPMQKTFDALNEMEASGIIGKYAIGGAIAAIYYIEPFATHDIDVFVALPTAGALVSLDPIYRYLETKGYTARNDTVEIEGWPVQFLPVFNALLEEALKYANEVEFDGTSIHVFSAEHLIAIMLQTGRPKDIARIRMFLEQKAFDDTRLNNILSHHGLTDKWYNLVGQQ